jgi:CheY-like chemotaxis protein
VSEPPNAAVLVVDDVPENRDLLVRRLKRLGINDVEQAANGIEALAAIERKNFDLVLLDIMMPELDGFGVLERLKQSGRINDLPVVVISALNEIEPVVRCVELGAEDFIFKPFNPTLLRARVMASLEKRRCATARATSCGASRWSSTKRARCSSRWCPRHCVIRLAARPLRSTRCSSLPRRSAATWSITSASARICSSSRSATCRTRAPARR